MAEAIESLSYCELRQKARRLARDERFYRLQSNIQLAKLNRRERARIEREMIRRDPYKTQIHADGTATYWSVYRQVWVRSALRDISDETLATLGARDRARIERRIAKLEGN